MGPLLFIILLTAAIFKEYIRRGISSILDRYQKERPILTRPAYGLSKYRILVVLGSGGHTTEMLRLLVPFKKVEHKMDIIFAVSDSDSTSLPRVPSILGKDREFEVVRVKRIREVGDSIVHSILKAPLAFISAFHVLWTVRPDVLVCNGPGTCLVLVYVSRLLQFLCLAPRTVRIFVESFCRVKTISLTGRLVYPFMDSFILQWPPTDAILRTYPRAKYLGRIL